MIPTVITPAASRALTTLANVKTSLNVTTPDDDAFIQMLIDQRSGDIAAYCRRTWGQETVRQIIRPAYLSYAPYDPLMPGDAVNDPPPVTLERDPVVQIISATGDGLPLVQDADFELDGFCAYRISNDRRVWWAFRKITFDYVCGYVLPGDAGVTTLPADVEKACIDLIAYDYAARGRDPTLWRDDVRDVARVDYALLGTNNGIGMSGGLPAHIAERLDNYVVRTLA